jgi:cellulose biosynthesis protein BcsQ
MTIIVVAANKGGVSKTTTSTTLAARLAQLEDTWLLDFDAQGHCGLAFGLAPGHGLYEWLHKRYGLARCLTEARPEKLRVLQGDPRTRVVEANIDRHEAARISEHLLALQTPFVVIDTSGHGPLQEIALRVADQIVIPFGLEQFGLEGVYQSLEMVRRYNVDAKVTLLPTRYDVRLSEQKNNLRRVQDDFQTSYGLVERAAVKQRGAVSRAQAEGQTIWEFESIDLGDVRSSYELLAARVLRLSGYGVEVARVAS